MNDGRAAVAFSRLLCVFFVSSGKSIIFADGFPLKDNKNEK